MGFDPAIFCEQPVDENLVCDMCHLVQQEPTTACKNGHTFCAACIREWENRSNKCPDCRAKWTTTKFLNRPLQSIIMSLRVKCPRKEEAGNDGSSSKRLRSKKAQDVTTAAIDKPESCDWEGTLSDYVEKHCRRECKFAMVTCPMGCKEMVRVSDIDTHKRTQCPRRMVECSEGCCLYVRECDMADHVRFKCTESTVPCVFCGEKMLRKLLGERPRGRRRPRLDTDELPQGQHPYADDGTVKYTGHYKICPKLKVHCEFHKLGCMDCIERQHLDEHHTTHARMHAQLVSGFVSDTYKGWAPASMVWDIPRSQLGQAGTSGNFSVESERHKVGNYQAYLKLVVNDGLVQGRVCVEKPDLVPLIDRLSIHVDLGGTWIEIMQEQKMTMDRGTRSCFAGGTLRCWECQDEDQSAVERDATPADIDGWFLMDNIVIRGCFRLKRPTSVRVGCKT